MIHRMVPFYGIFDNFCKYILNKKDNYKLRIDINIILIFLNEPPIFDFIVL